MISKIILQLKLISFADCSISDKNLKILLISANISEINGLNFVTNRDVMNKAS